MKVKHEIEIPMKQLTKEMKKTLSDNAKLSMALRNAQSEVYRLRSIIDKYSFVIDFVDSVKRFIKEGE